MRAEFERALRDIFERLAAILRVDVHTVVFIYLWCMAAGFLGALGAS